MRTNVRDSSLAAYDDLAASGKLGAQAARIVSIITACGGDWSLQEISKRTGIPINAVSGRVNDCKKAGVLVESDPRPCGITGRTIHPVKIPEPQLTLSLGRAA